MYKLLERPEVLAVVITLALGCADESPSPTAPDAWAEGQPAQNFTNGPESPGPFILRVDGQLVQFINTDVESNRLSLHFPTEDLFLCGGSQIPADPADAQFITTAAATEQFLVQIRNSESTVSIFSTADLAEAGIEPFDLATFCNFINGPKKIASGTVNHVQNLSSTSFAVRWGGMLEGSDTQLYVYNEHLQLLVLPSGEVRTTVSDINLTAH